MVWADKVVQEHLKSKVGNQAGHVFEPLKKQDSLTCINMLFEHTPQKPCVMADGDQWIMIIW